MNKFCCYWLNTTSTIREEYETVPNMIYSVSINLLSTMKPVYNDHLMGYFSAPSGAHLGEQKLLARVNWYFQSSFKHIAE